MEQVLCPLIDVVPWGGIWIRSIFVLRCCRCQVVLNDQNSWCVMVLVLLQVEPIAAFWWLVVLASSLYIIVLTQKVAKTTYQNDGIVLYNCSMLPRKNGIFLGRIIVSILPKAHSTNAKLRKRFHQTRLCDFITYVISYRDEPLHKRTAFLM